MERRSVRRTRRSSLPTTATTPCTMRLTTSASGCSTVVVRAGRRSSTSSTSTALPSTSIATPTSSRSEKVYICCLFGTRLLSYWASSYLLHGPLGMCVIGFLFRLGFCSVFKKSDWVWNEFYSVRFEKKQSNRNRNCKNNL